LPVALARRTDENIRRALQGLRRMAHDFFHPYRPELHYMRGPGPKWREKHGLAPHG
jgi:hypothetical protein